MTECRVLMNREEIIEKVDSMEEVTNKDKVKGIILGIFEFFDGYRTYRAGRIDDNSNPDYMGVSIGTHRICLMWINKNVINLLEDHSYFTFIKKAILNGVKVKEYKRGVVSFTIPLELEEDRSKYGMYLLNRDNDICQLPEKHMTAVVPDGMWVLSQMEAVATLNHQKKRIEILEKIIEDLNHKLEY